MIRPPENEWFLRVLLYWDKVGTILPEQYSQDHEFLRDYTTALIAEGLLTPIAPYPCVRRSGAGGGYREAFLDLVDSDPLGVETTPPGEREWARVHLDKTGKNLADALVARRLAREPSGPDDAVWIELELRTANLLMAFLASVIGQGVAMDPLTDSEPAMEAFKALPENSRQIGTELEPIRYALVRDILPGPAAGIEPGRLAEFKSEHDGLLTRFRDRVEQKVTECARTDDPRLRARLADQIRVELGADVEEIERRMSERRWRVVARGALGVAVAALGLAEDLMSGGSALGITAGSLGLAGSVDAAFGGRRRSAVLGDPLAYAALVRRELAA